jgi:predicted N-acetyltransferase YhbS
VASSEPAAASESIEGLVPLGKAHDTSEFRCGNVGLDQWLQRHALQAQGGGESVTYVVCRGTRIVGYYSIAPGAIAYDQAAARIRKGIAKRPIPVLLLAKLAIDQAEQGSGLGKALLKDALRRMATGAKEIGGRAIVVHAIDDKAKSFYERFDFEESPLGSRQLWLLMKDLRKTLELDE